MPYRQAVPTEDTHVSHTFLEYCETHVMLDPAKVNIPIFISTSGGCGDTCTVKVNRRRIGVQKSISGDHACRDAEKKGSKHQTLLTMQVGKESYEIINRSQNDIRIVNVRFIRLHTSKLCITF